MTFAKSSVFEVSGIEEEGIREVLEVGVLTLKGDRRF